MALERFSTRKSLFLFYPCLEGSRGSGSFRISGDKRPFATREIENISCRSGQRAYNEKLHISCLRIVEEKCSERKDFYFSCLNLYDLRFFEQHCSNIRMIATEKRKLIWMYISTLHNQVLIFLSFVFIYKKFKSEFFYSFY